MFNYLSWNEINSKEHRAKVAVLLHNERINANLTLEALEEKTGKSKPTVQSWEKGWFYKTGENILPSLECLSILSDLYECSPEYILCLESEKTKAKTDISSTIGLTEDSINILQKLFSDELSMPSERAWKEIPDRYNPYNVLLDQEWKIVLLSFLNFFIQNIEQFSDFLSRRRPLSLLQKGLEKEKYHSMLREAYISVRNAIHEDPDNAIKEPISLTKLLTAQSLMTYLDHFYFERATELDALFWKYLPVLTPSHLKQSDYAISETFMDIVKSYFDDVFNKTEKYHDFVDKYKATDYIKPLQIVRPSNN